MRHKGVALAGLISSLAIMAVGPGIAQAAPTDSLSCQFSGSTANGTGLVPPVQWVGGTGNFGFGGTGTCAAADSDGSSSGTQSINIQANGTYTNTVCGTGNAQGTATVTGLSDDGAAVTATANFSITFASGQGTLTIGTITLSNGDTGSGGGTVSLKPTNNQITPPNPNDPPTFGPCVSNFDVTGAFTAAVGP